MREAVANTEPPLSSDLTKAVIQLFDGYTRSIMRGHRGYALAERRASYETSLAIMELSCADLISAIDSFAVEALAENSTLFNRQGDGRLVTFEHRIQKELFATANAAASLVGHVRRVQKILNLPDFKEKIVASFGQDGLHEFVIALRVLLHHLQIVEAGWNTSNSFSAGKAATFMLHKEAVERAVDQYSDKFGGDKNALRVFVKAAPDTIDVKGAFEEYRRRLRSFYAWLSDELKADSLIALRDYDRIMLEKKRLNARMFWSALLVNWLRNSNSPPNPHDHLDKYLTPEQIAQVYALPRNSNEQVDLIISFVDTDAAIDDKLRQLAYELFQRSPLGGAPLLEPA